MLIKQIRSLDGTGTLSYLVASEEDHLGVIVDPNVEDLEKTEELMKDLDLRITHIIDTHTHADHISGAGELRRITGALTVMHANTANKWKFIDKGDKFGIGDTLRVNARIPVDRFVEDGDVVLPNRRGTIDCRNGSTPRSRTSLAACNRAARASASQAPICRLPCGQNKPQVCPFPLLLRGQEALVAA